MPPAFRVPQYLEASTDVDPEWLAALPGAIGQLTTRWQLRLEDPFEPGGNCSWVAPGVDDTGREIVLKVAWHHTEGAHEADALDLLDGRCSARLYRHDCLAISNAGHVPDTVAMVLERCRPGELLRTQPEPLQHAVIADLLTSVWSTKLPAEHVFQPLAAMAELWTSEAEAALDAARQPLDPGLARDGLALFVDLARPGPNDTLLCTDLHAGNVVAARRAPWLLIDPKPYVGDRHYDVTQHVLNCNASLRADPIGLATVVAETAGLDRERVLRWLGARCVQELLCGTVFPGLDEVLAKIGDVMG